MSRNILQIKNLYKTFPLRGGGSVEAVRDVSFDVDRGEIVSLIGPSGCGKTSILNMIANLVPPTKGEIIHMEDLGLFKPGEGYKAVEEGLTRLGGPKPINTSGGLKCKGHPVGATGIGQLYEVWKQLRNEAGERQVPIKDLRIGAAHNLGGTGGTCTFTILERR